MSVITESLMGIPAGSARHEEVSQILLAHLEQARQTVSEADAIPRW